MRCGKEESDNAARGKDNRLKLLDDEYAIVHCTGYIKVQGYELKLDLNNFTSSSDLLCPPNFVNLLPDISQGAHKENFF